MSAERLLRGNVNRFGLLGAAAGYRCPLRSLADIPTVSGMSALPPKADICSAVAHVRFVLPTADIAIKFV